MSNTFAAALGYAAEYGEDAGRNAAWWTFDGNTSEDTYRRFLQFLDDGDPRVDEYAPGYWLSGEFASGPFLPELMQDVGLEPDDNGDFPEWQQDEIATAYETAADQCYWAELESIARYHVKHCSICAGARER